MGGKDATQRVDPSRSTGECLTGEKGPFRITCKHFKMSAFNKSIRLFVHEISQT